MPVRCALSPTKLVLSLVLAIAAFGGVAYWDEQREARGTLDDFGHEQATLARGLAAALGARAAVQLTPVRFDVVSLRAAFAPLAETDAVALLREPGREDYLASTGERVRLAALNDGSAADACWLPGEAPAPATGGPSAGPPNDAPTQTPTSPCWRRLAHDDAAALGLPERTAMAGKSGFTDPDGGRWRVVVVTSARRERDRERWANERLVLGFALSSGLVLAFGMIALRKQQKELALVRELAARQRDERLVRADKLATMGVLAIGIAHEVSTPLGVIVGRAEQLAGRIKGDERAERAVRAITEQAARIEGVVRGLLTLARGGTPSLERVDPGSLARAAADLVAHRFEAGSVSLDVRDGVDLPKLSVDPRLLEQALVNLLLNACDACGPGGRVELSADRSGEKVAFVVTDDGAGIEVSAALRATEPFFTTKPEGKGAGLGLAIVNEIVSHHQGKFSIGPRSAGRGTEARIELAPAQ